LLSTLEVPELCESLDGVAKHAAHAFAEIERAWEGAGRPPLLALTQDELQQGRARLRALGLPDGAWFAHLHGGGESHLPAIEAIAARGGWVIRSGDTRNPAAVRAPNAIDVVLEDGGMDMYLAGACRFCFGPPSAQAEISPLFGVPRALSDWAPAGHRPLSARDLFLTKLYRIGSPPRPLSFAEMMAPPLGCASRYQHAGELGLAAAAGTPDEILELVREMLDRLDGSADYTDEDEALASAFDAVAETNLCQGSARAGRDFLRRHARLLGGETGTAP
jgi:putative glycosyltransferase (TIGR04372 family)